MSDDNKDDGDNGKGMMSGDMMCGLKGNDDDGADDNDDSGKGMNDVRTYDEHKHRWRDVWPQGDDDDGSGKGGMMPISRERVTWCQTRPRARVE